MPLFYRYIILCVTVLFIGRLLAEEYRGLWVVRYTLASQNEVDKMLRTARDLRITDLYVQVYALGQTWYPSRSSVVYPPLKRKDNFGLLVKKARQSGIRVHAWINVFFIWAGEEAPKNPAHPFNRFRRSVLNPPRSQSLRSYGWFKKQGIEGYFVDPSDRRYLQHIQKLVEELVKKYDLAGIHLDYLRYPEKEVTVSVTGRTVFRQLYFSDPLQVLNRQDRYIQRYGLEGISDFYSLYQLFLKQNIDAFLKALQAQVHNLDGNIQLSCAVKADARQAGNVYYQDWTRWLKDGFCDEIILMNYIPDTQIFLDNLNQVAGIDKNEKIRVGIALYNQSADSVRQKLMFVQSSEIGGYVLFSYNYLREHPAYLSRIKTIITAKNGIKK